jgi:hypothetical protein
MQASLLQQLLHGMLVRPSLGKFYALAGLRLEYSVLLIYLLIILISMNFCHQIQQVYSEHKSGNQVSNIVKFIRVFELAKE